MNTAEFSRLTNYQADMIEMCLHANHLAARVGGGIVAHRFIRYSLHIPLDRRPEDAIRQQSNISARLGLPCSVRMHAGALVVEVPLDQPRPVLFSSLIRQARLEPLVGLLGVDGDGAGLTLRLNSPEVAHILAAGATGSGKTGVVRSLLASLALGNPPRRLEFVVVDPQGRSYNDFAGFPHLAYDIVTDADDALYVLEQLLQERAQRERAGQLYPWRVVVLEELADLVLAGGHQVERLVARLAQRGRHAGYTIIGCAQKPTADAIGSLVKANFPTRLVGAVVSSDEAKLATGQPASGAEKLLGRGDLLLVVKGELIRFQAAYVSSSDVQAIGRRLAAVHPRQLAHRREHTPPPNWRPRVIQGGLSTRQTERDRRLQADARRLLDNPAWVADHIRNGQLVGNWQAAAGAVLNRPNKGGHHDYLKEAGLAALDLHLGSTMPARGDHAASGENRS